MTTGASSLVGRALAEFQVVVELDPVDRDERLAQLRSRDPRLADQVDRLLRADAGASVALPTDGPVLAEKFPAAPERIGAYRLGRRIGEGGMGEVYEAERWDGLFEQTVAIKRMRPSLLPETARNLFAKERRALARLNHRSIAQLFDGGVDSTGAPFLVMELVRGPRIDAYVAERRLAPKEIVLLLISVCEGVQHAHQNLIVHADLKPANILVNYAGDPKVVDFGVARLLYETDAPDAAPVHPRTPGYASPQRESGASPSPADDIYSLGAILRELLTGETPAAGGADADVSEILRRTASAGGADMRRLRAAAAVQGDLDAIVRRATQRDPSLRHTSVGALIEDLRNWLEVRPLRGRSSEGLYVAGKFLRRRALRVAAAAAATVGLLGALVVVSMEYARADRERARAEARFEEVRTLSRYLLYDVYDRLERTPQTLEVRRDVAGVAQAYLEKLAEVRTAPPEVRREVVEGLVRVAELQARRRQPNLGDVAGARRNLQRAAALLGELSHQGSEPGDDRQRLRIALMNAAIASNVDQDVDAASRWLGEAETLLEGPLRTDTGVAELRLWRLVELAELSAWKADHAGAANLSSKAVQFVASLSPAEQADPDVRHLAFHAEIGRGDATYYLGQVDQAERIYETAASAAEAFERDHPDDARARGDRIIALWSLGTTRVELGKAKGALVALEQADRLLPQLLAMEPTDANSLRVEANVALGLAQAYALDGRPKTAEAMMERQVARRKARREAQPDVTEFSRAYAVSLAALGDILAADGRRKEACDHFASAQDVFLELEQRGRVPAFDRNSGSWKGIRDSMAVNCEHGASPVPVTPER